MTEPINNEEKTMNAVKMADQVAERNARDAQKNHDDESVEYGKPWKLLCEEDRNKIRRYIASAMRFY